MNCRPGDLAMIVRVPIGKEVQNLGAFVRLVRIRFGADWIFEEASRPLIAFDASGKESCIVSSSFECQDGYVVLHDSHLMPIRPGDMEDETPTVKELEAV